MTWSLHPEKKLRYKVFVGFLIANPGIFWNPSKNRALHFVAAAMGRGPNHVVWSLTSQFESYKLGTQVHPGNFKGDQYSTPGHAWAMGNSANVDQN